MRVREAQAKLRICELMIDLAKVEGERFGSLPEREVSGLSLEHLFRELSKIAIGKDLYFGHANIFSDHFTQGQRKLLFHMVGDGR